ncbi:Ig-like domain-containing protein [Pseudomyxococcus flavus]
MRTPIQAVFSEAIDPSTVTAESVRLLVNQSEVAAEVRLSADGASVTVSPSEQIPVESDVSVTIKSSVTDMAGNKLDVTALDWRWSVPRHLLLGGAISADMATGMNVSTFSLVQDGNGRPVVAFVEGSTPSTYGVYVKRWSGETWELLGDVLETVGVESVIKTCALWSTPEGEIYVVWTREMPDGTAGVRVYRWNGSSWSPLGTPVTLEQSVVKIESLGFVVGPQGERWLVLHEYDANVSSGIHVFRWGEGSWERLGGTVLNPYWLQLNFSLMMDSLGRLVVVWTLQSGAGGAVTPYSKRWVGTHFEDMGPMSGWGTPMVSALDGEDRLILGMPSQDVGTSFRPWIQRSVPAEGWQNLGLGIDGMYPGATDSMVEVLDFDHEGRLVALFSEPEVAGGPVNHYVRRWDENSWGLMGAPLLPRTGSRPVGRAQFFMTGPEQWVLARIEETEGTPSQRHLYVYRPNN